MGDTHERVLGLWRIAEHEPDRLALVDPEHRQLSAAQLAAESNRLVHALRALGMRHGDALAVLVPNSITYYAALLACQQAGWQIVPINYHLSGDDVAYIVDDSEAKALIGHGRFADQLQRVAEVAGLDASQRFIVDGELAGYRPVAELVDGADDTLPGDRRAGGIMTYTSGTTGRPKGVKRPLPDEDPDERAAQSTRFGGMFGLLDPDHVHLVVAPLYHTAVVHFSQQALHSGHTVVLMDGWTPEGCLERIDRYGVTSSHMVPTMFNRMLKLPEEVRERYDVSSLRSMIHSAAPCPVPLKQAMMDWWGPVIYEYYGATEGGGTTATPQDWLAKPGTVGSAWPGSEIKILDDEGNELPPGEVGTIWMRMGGSRFEYKDAPEKTKNAWNEQGFFTVGDVGVLDEDGFLFLRDRKIDMIISGGVNLYPAEIEAGIIEHPAVLDVAVFGVPDDDLGEAVKAAVEIDEGYEPDAELEADIIAFAQQRLGRQRAPRSVDFPDEFPRDPNGKVYKRRLRDPYWADRDSALV